MKNLNETLDKLNASLDRALVTAKKIGAVVEYHRDLTQPNRIINRN